MHYLPVFRLKDSTIRRLSMTTSMFSNGCLGETESMRLPGPLVPLPPFLPRFLPYHQCTFRNQNQIQTQFLWLVQILIGEQNRDINEQCREMSKDYPCHGTASDNIVYKTLPLLRLIHLGDALLALEWSWIILQEWWVGGPRLEK